MRLGLLLCSLLLLIPVGCSGGNAVDWQPADPLDCRVELAEVEAALFAEVTLRLQVYVKDQPKSEPSEPSETETANAATTFDYEPPIPSGFTGDFESRIRPHGDGAIHGFTLRLRPTRLGDLSIEPFVIKHEGETVSTEAVELKVVSVLRETDDEKAAEEPAALMLPVSYRWLWIVLAVLGPLLIIGFCWFLYRPPTSQLLPVAVPVPPWISALRSLERLRHVERITELEIEVFYVDVSQILRDYLEGRFGLHAPLRSTEEFLIEVEAGSALSREHRLSLRGFLAQCDLVKFAKLHPTAEVHEETLRVAEEFVEETRGDRVDERDDLLEGGAA